MPKKGSKTKMPPPRKTASPIRKVRAAKKPKSPKATDLKKTAKITHYFTRMQKGFSERKNDSASTSEISSASPSTFDIRKQRFDCEMSNEKMMKDKEQYERIKEALRILEDSKEEDDESESEIDSDEEPLQRKLKKYRDKTPSPQLPALCCRCLSDSDLDKYYGRFSKYMRNIFSGKVKNTRHELYQKGRRGQLYYNTSSAAFSPQQIDHVLNLMRKQFDNGNIYKYLTYYMQVLVPEFCLVVFMDVHDMTREEAEKYLEERPAQIEDVI